MRFVKRYGPRSRGRRVDSGVQSPCLHLFAALRANAGSLQSSTSYVLLPRDSSASWSFRCVMCGTHFPWAQRMSPASSILAYGAPRACSVSVRVFLHSVYVRHLHQKVPSRTRGLLPPSVHSARSLEPGQDGGRAVGSDPPWPWSPGLTGRAPGVRGRPLHRWPTGFESRRLRLGV